MGIVNASPESFSDGGRFSDLESQVEHALRLVEEGATIIDVGGESGVTGLTPLTPSEELVRVKPLVEALVSEDIIVSVDTWKEEVATSVLDLGAVMINDVSGLANGRIASLCASCGAGLVVMHTRARPKEKDFPHRSILEAVEDVRTFLTERVCLAESLGLERSHIVVDPGPDFGKTPAQTVGVLSHLSDLQSLNCAILLSVSRKDFIGALTRTRPAERLPGTLAAIAAGVASGAGILRVHEVAEVRAYLTVAAALSGQSAVSDTLRLDDDLRREPVSERSGSRPPSSE